MTETNVTKSDTRRADVERVESGVMLPPVDVIEDALGITLYADLPGVPKDRLHVRIDADALTIEGDVVLSTAEGLEASHAEVQSSRYQRTFTLGKELDSERVSAEFRHGVLKLSIPKVEHAKPRKIEVQVA
ncbi:MAG: Hsp20/alpha crystallin family protein [Propionivibrio sp.]